MEMRHATHLLAALVIIIIGMFSSGELRGSEKQSPKNSEESVGQAQGNGLQRSGPRLTLEAKAPEEALDTLRHSESNALNLSKKVLNSTAAGGEYHELIEYIRFVQWGLVDVRVTQPVRDAVTTCDFHEGVYARLIFDGDGGEELIVKQLTLASHKKSRLLLRFITRSETDSTCTIHYVSTLFADG